MRKLIVSSQKVTGLSADGKMLKAFRTFVETKEGYIDLCSYFDVNGFDDLEIIAQIKIFSLHLKITPKIKKVIVDFLCSQHVKQDNKFDCYSFVCKYYGIEEHEKMHLMRYWQLKKPKFWPSVGDVIFLLDTKKQMFKHASIYIGWGIYASVYGAGGDIHFSTFKDLKEGFGGDDVYLAIPYS